jgi:hypothetical protein
VQFVRSRLVPLEMPTIMECRFAPLGGEEGSSSHRAR